MEYVVALRAIVLKDQRILVANAIMAHALVGTVVDALNYVSDVFSDQNFSID